jgi:UPF0755 protein
MKWLLRVAALLAVAGVAATALRLWLDVQLRAPGPAAAAVTIVLPKGTGTAEIGRLLGQAGLLAHPDWWPLLVRLSGRQALQAGEYEFPAHAAVAVILDMMRHGQVVVHRLTVAEGLTVLQVAALLQSAAGAAGDIGPLPAEGSLLPSTYFYSYGEERAQLVARMQRGMSELLDELWARRQPDPLLAAKADAVILASIVERETALAEERPHVAAVFLNRLRRHMRLQSDPTVIYALSNGAGVLDHPLGHGDLAAASPYNSYAVDGLPPGPICNPGRASLLAVLHPLASDDLYFVADGSGGHAFAASLAEHNRNVARWRQTEQQRKSGP